MTPLRRARTKRALTIYDVAAAVGVRPGTVSKAERGGSVSPRLAAKLAAFFGEGLTEEMVLYPDRFGESTEDVDQQAAVYCCTAHGERRDAERRQADRREADRRAGERRNEERRTDERRRRD